MILGRLLAGAKHRRRRLLVSLLAAGVLEGREREETLAHVQACPRCREEHESLRAVVAAMEADPLREAEPPVPVAFLVGRVEREVLLPGRGRDHGIRSFMHPIHRCESDHLR